MRALKNAIAAKDTAQHIATKTNREGWEEKKVFPSVFNGNACPMQEGASSDLIPLSLSSCPDVVSQIETQQNSLKLRLFLIISFIFLNEKITSL